MHQQWLYEILFSKNEVYQVIYNWRATQKGQYLSQVSPGTEAGRQQAAGQCGTHVKTLSQKLNKIKHTKQITNRKVNTIQDSLTRIWNRTYQNEASKPDALGLGSDHTVLIVPAFQLQSWLQRLHQLSRKHTLKTNKHILKVEAHRFKYN